MDSMKTIAVTAYGYYYAPDFSYYFSTGTFAWQKSATCRNGSR